MEVSRLVRATIRSGSSRAKWKKCNIYQQAYVNKNIWSNSRHKSIDHKQAWTSRFLYCPVTEWTWTLLDILLPLWIELMCIIYYCFRFLMTINLWGSFGSWSVLEKWDASRGFQWPLSRGYAQSIVRQGFNKRRALPLH